MLIEGVKPDGTVGNVAVDALGQLLVSGSTGGGGTAAEVEITNDLGSPIPVSEGLSVPPHDEIAMTYVGTDISTVTYKLAGATVATLTLGYTDGNLTSVVRV